MANPSNSIEAIKLARSVFESIHGNLGLLKFNINELTPKNGTSVDDSKKWEIICNFYETLGSTEPSTYRALVDLNNNIVSIKKIGGSSEQATEKQFKVIPQESSTEVKS